MESGWTRHASALAAATALALGAGSAGVASAARVDTGPGRAGQTIVFVLDGLRPDSINARDTPNLERLRREGANYLNSHAAVPTVTRVNASVIGSGSYPSRTGIVGNSMFVPEVDPANPFSTGEANNLTRLDAVSGGRLIFVKTLAGHLGSRVLAARLQRQPQPGARHRRPQGVPQL